MKKALFDSGKMRERRWLCGWSTKPILKRVDLPNPRSQISF